MNTKGNIAVVHGGTSSESAISTKNAGYIAKALEDNGYNVSLLDFNDNIYTNLQKSRPELVFVAVQGKNHGDGTLQAICEHLRLPYTGSKTTAAAIINDKCLCKKLCAYHGVRTPEFIYMNKETFLETKRVELLDKIEKAMPYPFLAKAITQGGSYGIEYIKSRDDYKKIGQIFDFDNEIIIERFIKGSFVTTPILEIENVPTTLPTLTGQNLIDEQEDVILFNKAFTVCEAELSYQQKKELEKTSIDVFRFLNAKNYARIDYMIEQETKLPYFIEINAVPGLKPESFYPHAAKKYGMTFRDLIEAIVQNELLGDKV
ncbi:MAG: ATP-grasp domain-containing protein [Velocimicrobium sp.]